MESCPTQTVLPSVGLAADKVIRDRYTEPHAQPRLTGNRITPAVNVANTPFAATTDGDENNLAGPNNRSMPRFCHLTLIPFTEKPTNVKLAQVMQI
ncbi:MAG: hypothetical protein ACQESR_27750 [Planctomycetota bacterium]